MTPEDILKLLLTLAPAQCQCFLDQLPFALPLEVLIKLGESIASAIESKTEKQAMQAAVGAADAAVDLAEANDLKLGPIS